MVGGATLTIVRSTTVMKTATASSEKARQRRTSPGAAASSRLTSFLRSSEVMPVSDARWSGPHSLSHRLRRERNGPVRRSFSSTAGVITSERRGGKSGCEDAMVLVSAVAGAKAGDEQAFRELTDPYRSELLLHCYQILGSVADAEDMLQDTLLAAWRGLSTFEGRSSVRAWLHKIAVHGCLNALRDRSRRPREVPLMAESPQPTRMADPVWVEPYPDVLLDGVPDLPPAPQAPSDTQAPTALPFLPP